MSKYTDLTIRFERVRRFIEYLAGEEEKELQISRHRDGPYTEALMTGISQQVESEIQTIKAKTGAEDLADADIPG
jgi:hypothetical protein